MIHSTQMYIPLKPLFSRHKGIGVQFTDEPTGNLEEENSHLIMDLLTKLNSQGMTILMVTHSPEMAAYAKKKIQMRDGRIL